MTCNAAKHCHHRKPTLSFFAVITATTIGLLVLLSASSTRAVEVLSATELSKHCAMMSGNPDGPDAQFCIRYIQGFIDGAVATDVRVMLNAESANASETFTERAMRTRAPTRDDRSRAANLAGFCLGDPLPLQEVVNVVAMDLLELQGDTAKSASAMEAVYDSLRLHYSCTS